MRKRNDRDAEKRDVRRELEALEERLHEESAEQTRKTLTAARERIDAIRAQLQEKNSEAADLERPVRAPVPDKRLDPDFMSGEPAAESDEADAASNSVLSPMEDRAILLRRRAELKRRARKSREPQEPDPSVRWVSIDEPESIDETEEDS